MRKRWNWSTILSKRKKDKVLDFQKRIWRKEEHKVSKNYRKEEEK